MEEEKNIPHIVSEFGQMSDEFIMQIPECCREGHEDCPHVVNRKPPRRKTNIGL